MDHIEKIEKLIQDGLTSYKEEIAKEKKPYNPKKSTFRRFSTQSYRLVFAPLSPFFKASLQSDTYHFILNNTFSIKEEQLSRMNKETLDIFLEHVKEGIEISLSRGDIHLLEQFLWDSEFKKNRLKWVVGNDKKPQIIQVFQDEDRKNFEEQIKEKAFNVMKMFFMQKDKSEILSYIREARASLVIPFLKKYDIKQLPNGTTREIISLWEKGDIDPKELKTDIFSIHLHHNKNFEGTLSFFYQHRKRIKNEMNAKNEQEFFESFLSALTSFTEPKKKGKEVQRFWEKIYLEEG